MRKRLPPHKTGVNYLTEGGQETEIMYRHGHDLPEFAMFALLDKPAAVVDMRDMYQRYLDTAAQFGFVAMMTGLDYRASPDWGEKLGYSRATLNDFQMRCIGFLQDVAKPYRGQLEVLVGGIIGPRGDAYSLNRTLTAAEAQDYHSDQATVLQEAGVDFVSALTLNSVDEAIGISRAVAHVGLPLTVSFMVEGDGRLKSGPSLREAIERTDAESGDDRPDFYGTNCAHPFEFTPALEPGDWIRRLRMLRPNASAKDKMELCQIGHLEEGDPQQLGRLLGDLAKRYPHIDVWGGCCGTWEKHLHEIATSVVTARS
jgi:S-methylmethionine-dependent homocysteine/selenocysteine methylase